MNLTGDPEGLAALKCLQEGNRDYLKFLIQEARSVFEHHVDFKARRGRAVPAALRRAHRGTARRAQALKRRPAAPARQGAGGTFSLAKGRRAMR